MDNSLQPTDRVPPEALNEVRLTAMLKTLQKQRETLGNEVVNLTAEVEQVEFKFKREQNLVRQQEAEIAQYKKANELLDGMNTEQNARIQAQEAELLGLRNKLAEYEQAAITATQTGGAPALSTDQITDLSTKQIEGMVADYHLPALTTDDIQSLTDTQVAPAAATGQ